MSALNPEKALIFRITHIDNVSWILQHGLHCQGSEVRDPNFQGIGLESLISRRAHREVGVGPGGTLSDYVPFYFTPYSIMMYNIKTGYGEAIKRENAEIVILVSSIHRLVELDVSFVFTNGHAYLAETDYFEAVSDLDQVDWKLLRSRDFKGDPDDPGKQGRYQAEALAHRHVPVEALQGIVCYNADRQDVVRNQAVEHGCECEVKALPDWYF